MELFKNKMTKLFFDTEFTGLHQDTMLISVGFVSEYGKEFYAEFNDFDSKQINSWLRKNILDNLFFLGSFEDMESMKDKNWYKGNTKQIHEKLVHWLNQFDNVEIWSDALSYDWVLFNQLFGHAFNIPDNVYYIPFDIATLFKIKGIDPDIDREEFVKDYMDGLGKETKHNALWDAKIIERCYYKANVKK